MVSLSRISAGGQMRSQGVYRDSVEEGDNDERAAFALRESELDESERGEVGAVHGDGEEGEVTNEKTFRYYKEMPDSAELRDANTKQPGRATIAGGIALLFGLGYLIAYACTSITRAHHVKKVNVILMISDGFGPASETFARSYLKHLVQSKDAMVQQPGGRWAGLVPSAKDTPTDYRLTLPLDSILIGSSRTRSSDSLVTDSAAGATAFSCAIKSYNGAIGVDPTEKRNPCGTVLEAARHQGYKTGLVVTSRITHATPAAFYAHVPDRDMESTIAEQMVMNHPLGQQVDLAFGGGLCIFLPNSSSTSCRADALDLIAASKDKKNSKPKYSFIRDRSAFDALPADAKSLGTIGLFGADHLEYEIDRLQMGNTEEEKQPALSEMADKAINILRSAVKSENAHGFFLMIEGSRIDMAGHSNDPVGHVHEILSYQETVATVKSHVDALNEAGTPTMLISVSDHETGGLSLGFQLDPAAYPTYAWFPDALVNGTATSAATSMKIYRESRSLTGTRLRSILRDDLGVSDPDEDELEEIMANREIPGALGPLDKALAKLTSRRAQVGWSTHGHSGVDVNLYGYPRTLVAPYLGGSRENTEIGTFIADTMKLDLKQITDSLQINLKAWYSPITDKLNAKAMADRQHSTNDVAHYHGQHRH